MLNDSKFYSYVIHALHAAPDIAPNIVMVTVVNSTAINVTWEEIPLMNRNGIITTYEVLLEPLQTFDEQLTYQQMNTSDLYILLDDLEEFVGYNISVRAYTSIGPGPYSEEEFGMTLEDSKCFIIIICISYNVCPLHRSS